MKKKKKKKKEGCTRVGGEMRGEGEKRKRCRNEKNVRVLGWVHGRIILPKGRIKTGKEGW